mgnify:CR=1 FL=1
MKDSDFIEMEISVNGNTIKETVEFKPYQSLLLKIKPDGEWESMDITFVPKEPILRPREKQRMHF